MIILYGAGEGFGLPEISPYVTKTEVQLRMAGLPYEKRVGRRRLQARRGCDMRYGFTSSVHRFAAALDFRPRPLST